MEFNDSHVKCTSLLFVVNTNHTKVVTPLVHVTSQPLAVLQATIKDCM